MFTEYFGLKEQPFGAASDPRFLFRGDSHREALAGLYCGLHGNRCFTVLIAEPGMGKTTLLYEFLSTIRDRARTAFVFNTLCDPNDLIAFILRDLGVTPQTTMAEMHAQLNEIVAADAHAGRRLVLVIDEAQNLSDRSLEAIRLLTNFESHHSKLMHVVLAGQPEFAKQLSRSEVTQFYQRVSTLCRLTPFDPADTAAYIAHRLNLAGHGGESLFSAEAVRRIAEESRGIPRIINTLCFNSLCLCRAYKKGQVNLEMIEEAIADLKLPLIGRNETAGEAPVLPDATIDKESVPLSILEAHRPRSPLTKRLALSFAIAAVTVLALIFGYEWQSRVSAGASVTSPSPTTDSLRSSALNVESERNVRSKNDDSTRIGASQITTQAQSTKADAGSSADPSAAKVVAGETLEKIAIEHLGTYNPAIVRQIQKLNPGITDPDHIEIGRSIHLPERGESTPSAGSERAQP